MVATRPVPSLDARASENPVFGVAAFLCNRIIDGFGKRRARHAVDGSKTVVLDAEYFAVLNLPFCCAVHENDAAKRVSEINAGGKGIERCLKNL
jgi:hypothetical protein